MISPSFGKRDSLLFVYGTLRPFMQVALAGWLSAHARYVGPARAPGRLYDLGSYPGFKAPRARHEWVLGDLYALRRPVSTLRTLDRYETVPRRRAARFERVRARVQRRGDRSSSAAWLYVYRGSNLRCARIRSGDYRSVVAPSRGAAVRDEIAST